MIQLSGARELAMISLGKSEKNGKYSNIELSAMLEKYPMKGADRALFTILYYGTLEKKFTLDYIIRKFSSIDYDEINFNVRNILRISLYQLIFLDRIPAHAVCDEAVKLTQKYSNLGASGYVNAMLRSFLRSDFSLDKIENRSVRYSYPEWMIELWDKAYGKEETDRIMAMQNIHDYTAIHVNTLKTTVEALLNHFIKNGIEATSSPLAQNAILIKNCPPPRELYGFEEGLWYIQDIASQFAIECFSPEPGEALIDCCACPGGKSFVSAIKMKNEGSILSLDLHKNKLGLIEKQAEKLGISIIKTGCRNATDPDDNYIGKMKKVICDVPCSGLGVISKKPDIRLKNAEDIAKLPALQAAILEKSALYLAPGGRLIYSTCTLNPAENENITDTFLDKHSDFHRVKDCKKTVFPKTLFPTEQNDGFFIDIIENTKDR